MQAGKKNIMIDTFALLILFLVSLMIIDQIGVNCKE